MLQSKFPHHTYISTSTKKESFIFTLLAKKTMEKRFVKETVFMEEAGNILACSMRSDGGERVKSSALYYLNAWNRLAAFVPKIIIHSKYFPNSDWLKAHA